MGDDLCPVLAPWVGDRRRHHLEILGPVVIGHDDETLALMLDGVFDSLAPGFDDPERSLGIVGLEHPRFGCDFGAEFEDHEAARFGAADFEEKVLVVLLVDEDVVAGRCAEAVAPQLVRAHGVVHPRIEESHSVGGPGRAVVDAFHDVVHIGAGGKVTEPEGVALAAVVIGRVGEEGVIGAHVVDTEGEEVGGAGKHVLVEEDLLFGVGAPRAPAVLGVLLALDRADVIPVPVLLGRHG